MHKDIQSLGLLWRDIDQSADIIFTHLLATRWKSYDKLPNHYYEHFGTTIISNHLITIATVNHEDYKKRMMAHIFPDIGGISLRGLGSDRLKSTASTLDTINKILQLQKEMKRTTPSKVKQLKEYAMWETVPVKITYKTGKFILAKSIDNRYKEINGKVYVDDYKPAGIPLFTAEMISDRLKVGDVINVSYCNNQEFQFVIGWHVYTDFYDDQANMIMHDPDDITEESIFLGNYASGTRWLTASGIILNIYDKMHTQEELDYIHEAMLSNAKIEMRISNINHNQDNCLVNGTVRACTHTDTFEPLTDEDIEEFKREASDALANDCVEYLTDIPSDIKTSKDDDDIRFDNIDGPALIYRALYLFSKSQGTTMNRVRMLGLAILLATCCNEEDSEELEFMLHELRYLECGIKFVRGENPSHLSIAHADSISEIAEVAEKDSIVEILKSYKIDDGLSKIPLNNLISRDDDTKEDIEKLVEASNILRGKIQDKSLARIKAEIASRLELSDEYIPDLNENEKTYYGEESIGLEFKSSIVFPPSNRQNASRVSDPDNQKWNIIKAICGFLNSQSGGELLIGVLDTGYACGIKYDIESLYNMGKISLKDPDKYRTYVKCQIEPVFTSYSKKFGATDISTFITYDIQKDSEGIEILRIRVSPCTLDAICISNNKAFNRPEWVQDSYQRTSGATVPLSVEMQKRISTHRRS